MRLIHTSDWHLGRTLHGVSLLDHQQVFLDWLVGQAVARQADAVRVAGAIYDRAVPPLEAVTLLDRTLTAFAQAAIPVVLISGNHDSYVRLGFGSALSERAGIHLRTRVADIGHPVARGERDMNRDLKLPGNADIDRMVTAVEKVWRRLVEMLISLQKDIMKKT